MDAWRIFAFASFGSEIDKTRAMTVTLSECMLPFDVRLTSAFVCCEATSTDEAQTMERVDDEATDGAFALILLLVDDDRLVGVVPWRGGVREQTSLGGGIAVPLNARLRVCLQPLGMAATAARWTVKVGLDYDRV